MDEGKVFFILCEVNHKNLFHFLLPLHKYKQYSDEAHLTICVFEPTLDGAKAATSFPTSPRHTTS